MKDCRDYQSSFMNLKINFGKSTLPQWWETHKQMIFDQEQCRRFMVVHFGHLEVYHAGRYKGWNNPTSHLIECHTLCMSRPRDELVHAFIHTLEEMPRSWYVVAELCKTITTWEEFSVCFAQMFSFQDVNREVCNALQIICDIVIKVTPVAYPNDPHAHCFIQSMMTCYNLSGEHEDHNELQNVNIPESEGSHDVASIDIPTNMMSQPLRIQKINIGSAHNQKFANVRDYRDVETMAKIMNLLHEFEDPFSMRFSEMKGILGDVGEIKIMLKPNAKPVQQIPYRLNP